MTHGYEYFDFQYIDLEDIDWMEDEDDVDKEISSLWGELEGIYEEMGDESEEYDIYEQEEEMNK